MPTTINDLTYDQIRQEPAHELKQTSPNKDFVILRKFLLTLPRPIPIANIHETPETDQMIGLERTKDRPDGSGFIAVVIDSGVAKHKSFGDAIIARLSVTNTYNKKHREAAGIDLFGHGTHMAGIIASREEHNGMGIASGAKIISIKVTDSVGGNATWSSIHKALLRTIAIVRGKDLTVTKLKERIGVVNLSFNGLDCLQAAEKRDKHKIMIAIRELEEMNIPVVISGGNAFSDYKTYGLGYPACNESSINVGAQFNYKFDGFRIASLATFSQRQDPQATQVSDQANLLKTLKNYYVAPGASSVSLGLSSSGNGKYSVMSGTSCSAAVVSACILILQEVAAKDYPNGIPVNILKKILMNESDMDQNVHAGAAGYPAYFDDQYYPGINLKKSIEKLLTPVFL